MATKITIDELVTKYIFEVDPKGAKEYEKLLDKSTARHKTETAEQTKNEQAARQKQIRATEVAEQRKRAAVEKSTKAGERAAKRFSRASERASKKAQRARAKAAELTTAGDLRAAGRQTRIAKRAARAKERAEVRAQKGITRASRRATRAIERDLRQQEKAAKRAARSKARAGGAAQGAGAAAGLGGLGGLAALGPAGIAAGAGAAGIAAAGKAISFVGDETARLDKIAKGAQVTGLGFKAYQELSQVATLSGTSIDTLAKGTIKLDRNLADVADGGGKKIAQNLKKLNLTLADFEGKTQAQKLAILSDALSKVDDDAQKTVIAIELMGKSGADLVPLLNSGSAAIDKMTDSVGKVFTREDLAKAEAYQDSLANLNKSLDFIQGSLVVAVTPSFQALSDAIQEGIPFVTEFFEGISNELAPAFHDLVEAAAPWVERLGPDTATVVEELLGPLRVAAQVVGFFAKGLSVLLDVGNRVLVWGEAFLEWLETRWPRAFNAAAAVVNALIHPLDTAANVIRRIFDFISKSVGKIDGLADKVKDIRAALGVSEDQEGQTKKQEDKKDDQADENRAKGAEARFRARESRLRGVRKKEQELNANAAAAQATARGRGKKRGKGGKGRQASGLEAQIDSQVKQLAAKAEIRASAQALQEGKGSKEAFAIGREAARQTEKTIQSRFDETGELPEGIARDISQLARSPAVEESIGRVPPPVISVVNNVTNNTVSGNEFSTNVDATLTSGVGVAELEQMSARATIRLLNSELGNAVSNVNPQTRV